MTSFGVARGAQTGISRQRTRARMTAETTQRAERQALDQCPLDRRPWERWLLGFWSLGLWIVVAGLGAAALDAQEHGQSLGAPLKYAADFKHLDYANPAAPQGGTVTLSALNSFDTLNPFSLKGRPPFLLEMLVFETLTTSSMDEPFAEYGLLASKVTVSADRRVVTFFLRPEARFADGHPLRAEDVVFSFELLRSAVASPFYRFYYHDVEKATALDEHTVRFELKGENAELPIILGQLPVLPAHVYGAAGKDFGRDFLQQAVGSGPYVVESFDLGKRIRYRKRSDYWGGAVPINRGRFNFARIVVKIYRDAAVQLEGLKAGEYDLLLVNTAKTWAVDVGGAKWERGWLRKERISHRSSQGIQGFAFNLRRPLFQDVRVRKALSVMFDFEWSNRTLFHGQYKASHSYFSNSELAARGLPSAAEKALLAPWKDELPAAVFDEPVDVLPTLTRRQRLREAKKLLDAAGWKLEDGVLRKDDPRKDDPRRGKLAFRFELTLLNPQFERIVEPYLVQLRRLGVQGRVKVVDSAVYERLLRTFDFDMIVHGVGQSQSPGNEQREYWGSEAALREGSRNLMGIASPAIDALVDHIVKAADRQQLITATHALDRALWHQYFMVPHWYIDAYRLAYWNRFGREAGVPPYYMPYRWLMYWWIDPQKEAKLAAERTRSS